MIQIKKGEILLGSSKIKLKSLILLCRQMATLLRAGVPLPQCFDIVSEQSDDKKLRKILQDILADVQSGQVLSSAIENCGDVFPPMMSKMIKVGEETGDLSMVMDRLATQYESDNHIKQKVKSAATYPMVLMVIALGVTVFMLISIVPRFAEVFSQLDSELPVLTRVLLSMSSFIITRWYILIVAVPVLIYAVKIILSKQKVRHWIDKQKLTLKLVKVPMQKIYSAGFARTLHTLIASNVPIAQALEYTKNSGGNVFATECVEEVINNIKQGESLSAQMALQPVFPKLLVSMVSIGEQSGNLEEMLNKTAEYYDEEMDSAISQIMNIMEPMMIVVVGLLVGGIVMALYAPMFGMVSAMQNAI